MSEKGRREFLRVCGLAALGLTGEGVARTLRQGALAVPLEKEAEKTGTRWAMVVDPKKCLQTEGCKDCIAACHHVHNVPEIPNPRHEVKWIWKEDFEHAFPEQEAHYIDEGLTKHPVLVFCNHCENPPCVRVCPTQATWKRDDGIVMMDWHRCIGCRYCVAGCPYGSRSFNWVDPRPHIGEQDPDFPTRSKGVVEKCTFCEERLEKAQPPACVEACKEGALLFGDLGDPASEIRQTIRGRFALRRKSGLGTGPAVYYLV